MKLGGTAGSTRNIYPNIKQVDKYQTIGRQFRYTDTTDTVPDKDPIYFVMWHDKFLEEGGGIGVANTLKRSLKIITYFAEPKDRS